VEMHETLPERAPSAPPPATAGPAAQIVYEAEFDEVPPRHLRDYLVVLYKYRWLAAACVGLSLGAAVVLTVLSPRLYTATVRLQVSRESAIQLQLSESVLNLEGNDRTVNGISSFLATQVAALESRDLAERVIRRRRLATEDVFLRPRADRTGVLAVGAGLLATLRPRGWESAPPATLEPEGGGAVDPALLDRYMGYLAVSNVRGTDLIEVRFTTPSPALSALLAAAHAQAYLEAGEEARLAADVTATDFLGRQLGESRRKVEQAEEALSGFAVEHPDVAVNQEQEVVGQRIAELSRMLTEAEGERVTLESRFEFLRDPASEPLAYFLDRPGVQKLQLALLDLGALRAGLGTRLGPKHPQMVELGRHEAELARQLGAEVGKEVRGVRAHFDAARAREERLGGKLDRMQTSAIALRNLGTHYDLLKSDLETSTALHQSLLKQQMETAVNSALVASNVRVIERPEVPTRPATPNVPLNLALGLLLGLAGAVGATLVCEHFDNSVKSSEEVEGLLQLPALATIPNFALARRSPAMRALTDRRVEGAGPRAQIVVLNEPTSPVAEAFRSLRTAVLFSAPAAPPKLILVTSAGAGEGKTVSALNLAASLAEAGSRVLLVDVDLRKPSCHRALGIENDRGLSSYLAGQVERAAITRELATPRLFFIPAGPPPPNPAELVGSARMREALAAARAEYDFVIVDSPPVIPVTDAVVLARAADGVLLVVKGHDTPRELVRRARDQLAQTGARLLGAVVNNVDLGWSDMYFYNRYYGYYRAPAEQPA